MTPSDEDLPFLIIHGAIVWKVLVVALTLVVVGVVQLVRFLRARRTLRADHAARLARATSMLEEGTRIVRGTLRGATVWSELLDELHGTELRTHGRTGEPWLDCGGERVELDGELVVGAGARVKPGRGVVGIRRSLVRSIPPGTEVIVEGRVAHRAGDESAGYRDQAGGWVLQPDGSSPVRIDALVPVARPFALGVARGFALVAIIATCSWGALRYVGKRALARTESHTFRDDGKPIVLSNLDAYSIAAAMPGSRAKAIERLGERLDYHRYYDTASLRREMAVAELAYGCDGVRAVLFRAQRHEDALAVAERCRLGPPSVHALLALGRYEDAAAQIATDHDLGRWHGSIAIAAGDWALAATIAEVAAEEATHPVEYMTEETRHVLGRRRDELRFRCLAAVFRERSGGGAAAPTLAELAAKPQGEGCALVAAAVAPAPDRAAALAAVIASTHDNHEYSTIGLTSLANDLAWADGVPGSYRHDTFYDPASALARDSMNDRGWLAPWATPALIAAGAEPKAVATARAWEAVIAALTGDLEAAQRLATEAERLVAGDEYAAPHARDFASAIALRGPRVDLPAADLPGVDEAIALRRGEGELQYVGVYPDDCEPDYRDAIRAAQRGDGAPLASVLQRCKLYSTQDPALLAVLARVERGKEPLVEALRAHGDDSGMSSYPARWVLYAATRRDLARLVGDDVEAARWQDIAARHAAPLRDRDRLVALLLWDP